MWNGKSSPWAMREREKVKKEVGQEKWEMRDRRTHTRDEKGAMCYAFATPAMLLLGYYLMISLSQCSVYNAHVQHFSCTHYTPKAPKNILHNAHKILLFFRC